MRVLGIDPGYDRLGIAVVEKDTHHKEELVYSMCFESDKSAPFIERLHESAEVVKKTINDFNPSCVAIEKTFFGKNQKTAIAVSEARGAMLYVVQNLNVRVYEYNPQEIKVAVTGYGKSNKANIANMVTRLLSIKKEIRHDDEFDAIAVALTHLAYSKNTPI